MYGGYSWCRHTYDADIGGADIGGAHEGGADVGDADFCTVQI